jgi:hypothetical protein
MTERFTVHSVGSMYPAPDKVTGGAADRDAVEAWITRFADNYDLLSHISVGERSHAGYVQHTVNHLADRFEARGSAKILQRVPDDEGLWRKISHRTRLRMPPGAELQPGDLDYRALAIREWKTYQTARKEHRQDGTWGANWLFQYSVPSPASLAVVALGPANPLRLVDTWRSMRQIFSHYSALRDATVQEVHDIAEEMPLNEAVAQVELTAEMTVTGMAHKLGMGSRVARKMGGLIADFICKLPQSVAVDLHACTGSLDNRAEIKLRNLQPFVSLVNETATAVYVRQPDRRLLHVHCPAAPSDAPVRTDERYFRPLTGLQQPDGMQPYELYIGLINNRQPAQEQLGALALVGKYIPDAYKTFGIATSCGLGRYDREHGSKVHDLLAQVALGRD